MNMAKLAVISAPPGNGLLDWTESYCELDTDGARDSFHVLVVEASESLAQAELADRGELVGPGLVLLVVQPDIGFRGVEAADAAGERPRPERGSVRG